MGKKAGRGKGGRGGGVKELPSSCCRGSRDIPRRGGKGLDKIG